MLTHLTETVPRVICGTSTELRKCCCHQYVILPLTLLDLKVNFWTLHMQQTLECAQPYAAARFPVHVAVVPSDSL